MRPITPIEFWAKVDTSGGPFACWPWRAALMSTGYGRLVIRERNLRAHRVAYELAVGPIPAGAVLRHSCDNRLCCNPRHLTPGTVADNNRDTAARGRHWRQGTDILRGEANPRAVLTDDAVRTARALAAAGEGPTAIARRLGVSKGSIQGVLHGRTWTHVG